MTSTEKALDRTRLTMRNATVSMLFFILSFFCQFPMRSLFIRYLGDDILGLNGTITGIIGFLNIAELGIATAIGFALYVPIVRGDQQQISEIISLQAWFYRIIAALIVGASALVLLFFPKILGGVMQANHIPWWYAYATFGVLLLNNLWGYLFNYRQVLLQSAMRGYKVVLVVRGVTVMQTLLQLAAIYYFREQPHRAYGAWLLLLALSGIVQTLLLEWLIHRNYPWLKCRVRGAKRFIAKYPLVLKKTSEIFFHKICQFIITSVTPLIILYVFQSDQALFKVTLYQNYFLVFTALNTFLSTLFDSLTSTVGNMIADKVPGERIELLFRGFVAVKLWLSMCLCFGLYFFSAPFMDLWVGEGRIFSTMECLFFVFYCFTQFSRLYDVFLYSYGLFQDIWAPIVEGIIALLGALLLAPHMGMEGIFIAFLASQLLIVHLWKPYFLYTKGFGTALAKYYRAIFPQLLLMTALAVGYSFLQEALPPLNTWFKLLTYGVAVSILYAMACMLLSYLLLPSFRKAIALLKEKVKPLISKVHS